MRCNSIRTRLFLVWGLTLLLVTIAIIAIGVTWNFHLSVSAARQEVLASTLAVERQIRHQMELGLDAARTLSHALHTQVDPNSHVKLTRKQVNAIIRQIVMQTPQIIGSCTQWKPNAFDGRDHEYAGTPMHDKTGQFIPYWYRNSNGSVNGEPLHDYEQAEWWTEPLRTKLESVIEPYTYEIEGEDVWMTTFSVPIIRNGVVYGICTTDIGLNFIQRLVDDYKSFNGQATIIIFSSGGHLLAVNGHPEYRGTHISNMFPQFIRLASATINSGVAIHESDKTLAIVSQLRFGNTITPWYVGFIIPMEVIIATPRKIALQQVFGGMAFTIFGSILFWILIGQITRPLGFAAALAHEIRDGDFSRRLNIQRDDEVGQLGAALDSMSEALQLRTMELSESRLNLAVTLDSIGDAVITTDTGGRITRMNPVAEVITGWNSNEAIGRLLPEVCNMVNAKTRESLDNPADKVLATNRIASLPEHTLLIGRNGNEFLIQDSAAPIKSHTGDTIGVVFVFHDVTEETKLQDQFRQSQKMDAVGQLAGGIAHDFNNMLGGIIGSCEILQSKLSGDSRTMKYLDIILHAAKRAADLSGKLLAFSRRQAPASTPIDIHNVIIDSAALLRNTIDKRIEIRLDLSSHESMIIGDNTQLQSVFINLGINASHAMPNGGILTYRSKFLTLTEAVCAFNPFNLTPGYYIQIEVSDTGHGIAREHLPRIFDPFFTTKDQGKGTGLGLAASYGTVKQHKGSISVYSEVGIGTYFHLLFPLTAETAMPLQSQNIPIRGEGVILLVDDELVMRDSGKTLLEDLGYNVLLAENGIEAVEILKSRAKEINLVLLDMIMPKMNGHDCFNALRTIRPDLPVIFSSGFADLEELEVLKKQGFVDFIQKPYYIVELSHVVANALERNN